MLYQPEKYGGIVAIFLFWLFLILPFLILRPRMKIDLISKVVRNRKWGWITKSGILACGISQTIFAIFLYGNFLTPVAKIGALFYGIGSFLLFLSGFIDYDANVIAHRFLVKAYYFWMTVGFFMASLEMHIFAKIIVLLLVTFPLYFFLIRGNEIVAEFLVIILSTLYIIGVYAYLGNLNLV